MGQSLYILPWPPSTLRGLISSMLILLRPTRSALESYYPFICKCHVCQIPFSKSFSKLFRAPFFQKRLNLGSDTTKVVASPKPGPTRLASPNQNPGNARFYFFLFSVLFSFCFQKCRDPNPRPDPNGGSEPEPGLLRRFHLS